MIVTMYVSLLAVATLVASAFPVRAAVRNEPHAGDYLVCAGSVALICFVMLPDQPFQMSAVALLAIGAGVILSWRPSLVEEAEFGESTLSTRRK